MACISFWTPFCSLQQRETQALFRGLTLLQGESADQGHASYAGHADD
jgi:hypothetical protein